MITRRSDQSKIFIYLYIHPRPTGFDLTIYSQDFLQIVEGILSGSAGRKVDVTMKTSISVTLKVNLQAGGS
ncbi:MAG: hypothetical protein JW755_04760 [Candidatus Aminicenantes bacterium]|nr:hypothetical protein [Candidatus Aminicenantes bacterium]